MIFKKLKLEDKDLLDKYINPYEFLSCEYSFTTLYIWKDVCDIQYAVYKGALIIKKKDFEGNYHFMQPLGYKEEDLKELLKYLTEYKEENDMRYVFKDIEEDFIKRIESLCLNAKDMYIKEDRDNFDYLYEAEKLIKLSGKKLHGKKNHYNAFVKKYSYEVKEIDRPKVIEDVISASTIWYNQNNSTDKILYYETLAIKELVENMKKLNLKGIVIYIDGKVAAFSLGEKLNDKLAVIHIEKADMNYRGIYSFINKTFIDMCFSDVKIINREQDLGIEGLRKAKLSYYPVKLEKKFIVSC